jgi:hypothetical protein
MLCVLLAGRRVVREGLAGSAAVERGLGGTQLLGKFLRAALTCHVGARSRARGPSAGLPLVRSTVLLLGVLPCPGQTVHRLAIVWLLFLELYYLLDNLRRDISQLLLLLSRLRLHFGLPILVKDLLTVGSRRELF